jgi:predicted GIY-YIG superfamily endonuclease
MKTCIKCNKEKPLTEFNFSNKKRGYIKSYCKKCSPQSPYNSNWSKEYYKNRKDDIKLWHNKWKEGNGVYGIFENDKCLYVGESSRVNERMSKHRAIMNNNKLSKHHPSHVNLYSQLSKHKNIIVKLLEKTDDNKEREKYFIKKLKPLYNAFA